MATAVKSARGIHWVALFASSVLEAVWALALDASRGFSVPVWTGVFLVACSLSMVGLAYAMKGISIGVAYAVWTGTGAALTVTVAMLIGSEPVSLIKVIFLAGIVGCVVGLRFTEGAPSTAEPGIAGAAE